MILFSGTGPNDLESEEFPRLSPMTKTAPAGTTQAFSDLSISWRWQSLPPKAWLPSSALPHQHSVTYPESREHRLRRDEERLGQKRLDHDGDDECEEDQDRQLGERMGPPPARRLLLGSLFLGLLVVPIGHYIWNGKSFRGALV